MSEPTPRIAPGSPTQIGLLAIVVSRAAGLATGGGPPNVFTTLARHRRLFRRWLLFAGALMPGGRLPRADTELLILRTAHNCGSPYEWQHHQQLGRAAGLSAAEVSAVRMGPDDPIFSPRQRTLLRAADELHRSRDLPDPLWGELALHLNEVELIELCMLVGHYEMLAMTLNSLRVVPDRLPASPPAVSRLLQRLAGRAGR